MDATKMTNRLRAFNFALGIVENQQEDPPARSASPLRRPIGYGEDSILSFYEKAQARIQSPPEGLPFILKMPGVHPQGQQSPEFVF